jgi:hypothetical protein
MNDHSIVFASFDSQTVGRFLGLVASGGFVLCSLFRGAVQ